MKKWTAFFLFLCLAAQAPASQPFWIEDGDELLFWGDSITDDGIYPRIVENYVLTYFPEWRVTFVNLGWGGDRASYFPRLERDIPLARPTKATIMLGMNDGRYQAFQPSFLDAYVDGMRCLLGILEERSKPRVMLISATPYDLRPRTDFVQGLAAPDQLTRVFYPPVLGRYASALQRIAEEKSTAFYDLHRDMTALIEDMAGVDGNYQITSEGIHPNIDGEVFMGLGLLDRMAASKEVMRIEIDAGRCVVDSVAGCTVSKLFIGNGLLRFTRNDERLPMPLYPSVREILLRLVRYESSWNRDVLQVAGLDSGWYELRVDGVLLDVLPSDELKTGVNLSRYAASPMMLQACRVFEATEKRQDAFYAKWRYQLLDGVRSPSDYTPLKTDADVSSLDRAEASAFAEQHRLNKPQPHAFSLAKTSVPDFSRVVRDAPCSAFLDGRVKIRIEIDSGTLRGFEPPLCLHGNFTYAPQYRWAILETKGYYTDVPVKMSDDGTLGDKKAGDGVYTADLILRKNCGTLEFEVQDGRYIREYWNFIDPPSHRNAVLDRLTSAWGKMLKKSNDRGSRIRLSTAADTVLVWNKKAAAAAAPFGY